MKRGKMGSEEGKEDCVLDIEGDATEGAIIAVTKDERILV